MRDDPRRQSPRDAGLRREARRLRRAFAALLVATAPPALLSACSHAASPGGSGPDQDGGPEADAGGERDCTIMQLTDTDAGCTYLLPCGLATGLAAVGCDIYVAGSPIGCTLLPDAGCVANAYVPGPGGAAQIACPGCLGSSGRKPRGLRRAPAPRAPTPLGAYFARMAHEEAASVHAFVRMDGELAAHGAPVPLRRAARRAAEDEERHARAMARHARVHGTPVPVPRVRSAAPRALEAFARENAVEGCVHETFGALVLAWQAVHAESASLRRTFRRIAADEARHAALSWAVAGWAESRLDPAERARVAAARARAVRALRGCAGRAPFDEVVGRPGPARRAALVDGLARRLGLE